MSKEKALEQLAKQIEVEKMSPTLDLIDNCDPPSEYKSAVSTLKVSLCLRQEPFTAWVKCKCSSYTIVVLQGHSLCEFGGWGIESLSRASHCRQIKYFDVYIIFNVEILESVYNCIVLNNAYPLYYTFKCKLSNTLSG